MIPQTNLAKRVAAIVHRRETTPWSEKEVRAYKKLYKAGAFNERDISSVERFQAFQRRRGENGFHRRGLLTLLNHWGEEVDHGTEHDELHPIKPPPRKIIPLPPTQSERPAPLSEEESRQRDKFLAEYQDRKARRQSGPSRIQIIC
jgi:hypothetical protein